MICRGGFIYSCRLSVCSSLGEFEEVHTDLPHLLQDEARPRQTFHHLYAPLLPVLLIG